MLTHHHACCCLPGVQGSRSANMRLSPTSLRNQAARDRSRCNSEEERAAAQQALRGVARQQGIYKRKVVMCLDGLLMGEEGDVARAPAHALVCDTAIDTSAMDHHEQATGRVW